ncbi:Uncharacterised protein [Halioglobus japonicus]|nr:Uncharacterised protein [Halioglobus japonicus]
MCERSTCTWPIKQDNHVLSAFFKNLSRKQRNITATLTPVDMACNLHARLKREKSKGSDHDQNN